MMADETPKPRRQATAAELRRLFIAEFGYEHPVFAAAKGWPTTVEDAKPLLKAGLDLFRAGYHGDGGRVGMLCSLEGALEHLRASLSVHELDFLDPLIELNRVLLDLELTGNRSGSLTAKRRGNPDSDAVADVKARAIAVAEILKEYRGCPPEEADKQAATLLARAAAELGIPPGKTPDRRVGPIDEKTIESWRRSTRNRGVRDPKDAPLARSPFRRKSLAERVEDVLQEFHYKANSFAHCDYKENGTRRLDLDQLICAILEKG